SWAFLRRELLSHVSPLGRAAAGDRRLSRVPGFPETQATARSHRSFSERVVSPLSPHVRGRRLRNSNLVARGCPLGFPQLGTISIVVVPVQEEPCRKHQVKHCRDVRREPAALAINRKA